MSNCSSTFPLRNSVVVVLQQKGYLFELPSTCRPVHHPISYCRLKTDFIYDVVFRTYPVRESGRILKQSGVDCKLLVVIPCVLAGDDHYRLCLLIMVAVCFFEKLLPTCQTARCHRGDGNNMKLYIIKLISYFTMFCFG